MITSRRAAEWPAAPGSATDPIRAIELSKPSEPSGPHDFMLKAERGACQDLLRWLSARPDGHHGWCQSDRQYLSLGGVDIDAASGSTSAGRMP